MQGWNVARFMKLTGCPHGLIQEFPHPETRLRAIVLLARVAAILLLAGWAVANGAEPHSTAGTVEDRLDRLERELKQLQEENRALRQGLVVTNAALVRTIGPVKELRIGGLVQAQAEFGDQGDLRWASDHDRFYLRRVRLNTLGKFAEHFDFRAELEVTGTLGEATGLRAQLTDGWVNWNRYDAVRVKVGQFFPPHGFEKRQAPAIWHTAEMSLAGDQMLLDRQIGAQLWGDGLEKRAGWALGVFNGMNANNSFNDNDNFMAVARVEGKPFRGRMFGLDGQWAVGLSGYHADHDRLPLPRGLVRPGDTNVFAGQRLGWGVDTQLRLGPVDVWSEYMRTEFDPDLGTRYDAEGWYVLAGYYLLPERFQAVVKYETFDPDMGQGGNSTDTWTFGLSYAFRGYNLKLFANYLLFEVPGDDRLQQKVITRLQAAF
jgi:phosphate-selective porin OprO and OprP